MKRHSIYCFYAFFLLLKANVPPTQLDSSRKVQIRQYRCLQLILDGPVVRILRSVRVRTINSTRVVGC